MLICNLIIHNHFFFIIILLDLVEKLDIWAAGGLGYTLAQFFMIKYFVFYGLPSSLAQLDGINAPPPPKCISRIHLYSQMWRDFDRGLYNFMLSYIYIPIKGQSNSLWAKLKGSAATFFFVCIWHGGTSAVVIWCICNYLGICLEKLAGQIAVTHPLVRLKVSLRVHFHAPLFNNLNVVTLGKHIWR